MKNNFQRYSDLLVLVLLLLLVLFAVNPYKLWMPSTIEMMLVGVFAVIFIVITAIFWRERARDEREEAHLAFSGRIAFFVGTVILAAAAVVQVMNHDVDPWVFSALFAMILSKVAGRYYAERNR